MSSFSKAFAKSVSAVSGSSKASAAKKQASEKSSEFKVEKKLRKHKLYRDLGGEELRMEVVKLTNVDEILLKFSHLVEEVLIQQVEMLNEMKNRI